MVDTVMVVGGGHDCSHDHWGGLTVRIDWFFEFRDILKSE